MIRSVGIDFGIVGPNRVRCLDEQAQLCGSFSSVPPHSNSPQGVRVQKNISPKYLTE